MNNEPTFLYRAFQRKEHAILFLEGNFRLSLLIYYKEIEDKERRDKSEGQSSSYIKRNLLSVTLDKRTMEVTSTNHTPGLLHLTGAHIDPMYLMCTCGPDAELNYIRKNFGEYVVKINAPKKLLEDINISRPLNSKMEFIRKCVLERVRYTKDQIQNLDPDSIDAVKLSYLQKPPCFSRDFEYRYIVTAKPCINEEPETFIWYNLNQKLDYLEII